MSILNILELVELLKTIETSGCTTASYTVSETSIEVWVTDDDDFISYYRFNLGEG